MWISIDDRVQSNILVDKKEFDVFSKRELY